MVLSGSEWRNPEQWELKYPPPGHMNTRDGGNQSSDITVHVRSETSTIQQVLHYDIVNGKKSYQDFGLCTIEGDVGSVNLSTLSGVKKGV